MDMKTLRRMSLFEKVDFVRRLVVEVLGVDNDEVILRMLSRLAHKSGVLRRYGGFYYTREEQVLGQLLADHGMSSKTVYTWFLLSRSPKNLLEMYRSGEISQNQLLRMKERRAAPRHDKALEAEILNDVKRLIEAL